jgi:hypothetical protein
MILKLYGWILLSISAVFICICTIATITHLGKLHKILDELASRGGLKEFYRQAFISVFELSNWIWAALLMFGIYQLIRYAFDKDCDKPGFVLRHAHILIYGYIVFDVVAEILLATIGCEYSIQTDLFRSGGSMRFFLLPAKLIILAGVAEFLRRLMPVIEEHKSTI